MEKEIGAEGSLKVEMIDGNLVLSASYDGKGADASLSIKVDSDYLIDQIGKLIPGDSGFELAALALLKSALKSAKI